MRVPSGGCGSHSAGTSPVTRNQTVDHARPQRQPSGTGSNCCSTAVSKGTGSRSTCQAVAASGRASRYSAGVR